MDEKRERMISRRSFVAGAAASAAVLGLSACTNGATSDSAVPDKWDGEADVIVVGAGGAGYMAACAAKEAGASVLLIEKGPAAGGDTAICECLMDALWPDQTEKDGGKKDDLTQYLTDWKQSHKWSRKGLRGEELPAEFPLITRLLEKCPETMEWLVQAGVGWVPMYEQNFEPAPHWHTVLPRVWGAYVTRLIPPLQEVAQQMEIDELLGTRVHGLITNTEGRVLGVRAIDSSGESLALKATKSVVLATGSFLGDRGMVMQYFPDGVQVAPFGWPTNTGDGHKMVEEIGGRLKDMDLGSHWMPLGDGSRSKAFLYSQMFYGGSLGNMPGILINLEGKRFMPETAGYNLIGGNTAKQKLGIAYYVLDSSGPGAKNTLENPAVNGSEIVISEPTIDGLATRMGVDAGILNAEVAKYNGFVKAGKDLDFDKVLPGCEPIQTPPFYAVPIEARPYATYGGIETDVDSRVLASDGLPIPGLYAAGICTGSYGEQEGVYYPGGVGQAMIFGRQAGQNAAAETAWE